METQATGWIGFGPILFIPDHRATRMSQMNPNLMTTSGFQSEIHQGTLGGLF
jgi:hypothetical protein